MVLLPLNVPPLPLQPLRLLAIGMNTPFPSYQLLEKSASDPTRSPHESLVDLVAPLEVHKLMGMLVVEPRRSRLGGRGTIPGSIEPPKGGYKGPLVGPPAPKMSLGGNFKNVPAPQIMGWTPTESSASGSAGGPPPVSTAEQSYYVPPKAVSTGYGVAGTQPPPSLTATFPHLYPSPAVTSVATDWEIMNRQASLVGPGFIETTRPIQGQSDTQSSQTRPSPSGAPVPLMSIIPHVHREPSREPRVPTNVSYMEKIRQECARCVGHGVHA